ncbi:hypothetical protein CC85DRAFT_198540 [Cutaneotrichosporon oleaginosum]|uniref:Uncharacterized protein n=1 Tax=Cutaneotrichosporon oleaginosum TaxID=879819 RepID=A0A0J0XDX4_9TREE|nr:uncharacterized protein CC85DRAFT_198540 [Cutaneotrichosporon oleaginosum]KLT39291.1 hypothetical protein CC85DRAFT_198540 [Cutaneotrichosporon oleaginosum]TXT08549.1 hypothetical protein COLE_05473 [Cutaneotrichosporon oleaginosum]
MYLAVLHMDPPSHFYSPFSPSVRRSLMSLGTTRRQASALPRHDLLPRTVALQRRAVGEHALPRLLWDLGHGVIEEGQILSRGPLAPGGGATSRLALLLGLVGEVWLRVGGGSQQRRGRGRVHARPGLLGLALGFRRWGWGELVLRFTGALHGDEVDEVDC